MEPFALGRALSSVRESTPLVHCITNYVTVNDCANALLALGASPIMSDEPQDVEDITALCNALVLNIGTLNQQTIAAMQASAAKAEELQHPLVLDPVGAGASHLRTRTASDLLDGYSISILRGNMSEVKALAGASATTRGVDADPSDAVTEENLSVSAAFAQKLAARTGAVVAITGAIDVVADASRAFAIRNGCALMGRITGTGCMLSALLGAFAGARPDVPLEAALAAVAAMGVAGEQAAARMTAVDGSGSFRVYLMDALFNLSAAVLEEHAKVSRI